MKQKPTDYRNRIKALEYVNSADLTPHRSLCYGRKIGRDLFNDALRHVSTNLRRKPFLWQSLTLSVVTPSDPMTEGNDIELVSLTAYTKRYPVVGGNRAGFTGRTTNSARIFPVSKASFPVLGGEVAAGKSKRQLPRSIPESNRNPVLIPIVVSCVLSLFIMALIRVAILSQAFLAVVSVVSPMPFAQTVFIRRPILNSVSKSPFTFALIASVIAGARLIYIRIVRALFPFFNQFGIFLSLSLHVFTRVFSLTLNTDPAPPKLRFRQFPLALRASFHCLSLQDMSG